MVLPFFGAEAAEIDRTDYSTYSLKEVDEIFFDCLRSDASRNYRHQWSLAQDFGAYFVGAACRAHNCPERAVMIADLQTRQITYGMLHYFPWTGGRVDDWEMKIRISIRV
ncbi:MAG: hypothetical protein COB59_05870 [Rhodospirillaceae bacterium]|nr:MAG: hypothetical protein COB59_05870 [Rhodospirillaceae bacterium]